MSTLLLFSNETPCWDQETLALAGEKPESIEKLLSLEYLTQNQGAFVLTRKGELAREDISRKLFISANQIKPFNVQESLWNNRLHLLMDRAFVGRFGIKEFTIKEKFEIVPYFPSSNLYYYDGENLEYLWQKESLIKSLLRTYPKHGNTRDYDQPSLAMFQNWIKTNNVPKGDVSVELMLRNRYDFELYRSDPDPPNDKFRMKNADRFFFIKAKPENTNDILKRIGLLHIFMLTQRHIYIPGYADFDSQMQENWTVIVLVSDNENEIDKLHHILSPFEKQLIAPAAPIYIIATSIERLRQIKKPKETVYDWFCEDATHIARADVPI